MKPESASFQLRDSGSYRLYLNFSVLNNKDDNMKSHRGNTVMTGDNTYKRLSAVSDSHLCLKAVLSQLTLDMHTFGRTPKCMVFPIGKMEILSLFFGAL